MNPLLVPIAAAQGRWMRSTIKLASLAAGPTSGTIGDASRPPVRIAVVGESTAAGCGVDTHDHGFPGYLARELAARTRRPVTWEVVGQFGATARRIRYRLLPRLGENLHVAVLLSDSPEALSVTSEQPGELSGRWSGASVLAPCLRGTRPRAGHGSVALGDRRNPPASSGVLPARRLTREDGGRG